jgi:hypothetical protein
MILYHHTSLAHLPYILLEGALVPTIPQSEDWPKDFVWATSDARGDRTTGICSDGRHKSVPHVRIGLKVGLFLPWIEQADAAGWGELTRTLLIRHAGIMGQRDTSGWYACQERVDIDEIVSIEMRTWSSPWRGIVLDNVLAVEDDALTFDAAGRPWWAVRKYADGRLHYICKQGEIK